MPSGLDGRLFSVIRQAADESRLVIRFFDVYWIDFKVVQIDLHMLSFKLLQGCFSGMFLEALVSWLIPTIKYYLT